MLQLETHATVPLAMFGRVYVEQHPTAPETSAAKLIGTVRAFCAAYPDATPRVLQDGQLLTLFVERYCRSDRWSRRKALRAFASWITTLTPQDHERLAALAIPNAPHAALLISFGEYLKRQEAFGRMNRQTSRDTFRIARTFLAAHTARALAEITTEHLEQFLVSRGMTPRSMQTVLMRLRVFFRWMTQQRLLNENPCDGVSRPRWRPTIRPAPTYQEFLTVCRQCRTLEEAALVEGFYYTGLRMGELRSLRVGDLEYGKRRVSICGKGGKHRTVVFPPHVADLWQAVGGAPDHRLFCGRRFPHRAQPEAAIGATIKRLGREVGLPYKLTAHVLRHGFFRLMKTRGVSVEVAARLGGHSNVQLTVHIYGQLDDDDLQSAYDRALAGERE